MKNNAKKIAFLLMVLSVLLMFPFETSANSPKPTNEVDIVVDQLPNGCVYADLLVKIDSSHEKYVGFNSEYGNNLGLDEYSEIATYNEDGFISYTFHFLDAVSDNLLKYEMDTGYIAKFAYVTENDNYFLSSALDSLEANSPDLKLALFNADGEIMDISAEFNIAPDFGFFMGYINYSPANESIDVKIYNNALLKILDLLYAALIVGYLRIIFSIATETLIAIPFKLGNYHKIVITNLVSQIILTLAFALSKFDYLLTLIIIEALVYIAEFVVYTILFKKASRLRILAYTIIANTVTLGLGLLLNEFGIFKG